MSKIMQPILNVFVTLTSKTLKKLQRDLPLTCQEIRHKSSPRHGVNSHGISIMPALGAWRYLHKLVKLLDMDVTTFPLQEQVQKELKDGIT